MVDEIPVSTMIWECAAVVHGIDVDRAIASVVLLPGEFGRGREFMELHHVKFTKKTLGL